MTPTPLMSTNRSMLSYENITLTEAVEIQKTLRHKLDISERNLSINTIGGADISLNLYSTTVYAGIIVLSFPELKPLSYALVKAETRFPYVPGFLAFRETPSLLQAWELLVAKPDVLVVDGHGITHARRMGIASHFGALTGAATIGCAKKILFGKYEEPPLAMGEASEIRDKEEVLGYALRSKSKTKPVFISPGNKLGLENSLAVMRDCLGKYRIPEPTRLAHELVNRFRRGELAEGAGTFG